MFTSPFGSFRSRLFDLVDEFHEPFFVNAHDPFFSGSAPLMLDPSRSSTDNTKEEKRVTKPATATDAEWGWLNKGFRAPMDVSDGKENFTMTLDVPGVKPEEIKVEIKDGRLTISGSRVSESRENNDKFQRFERSSGLFSRSIVLPRDVDQDKIVARHDNGVLRLTIPKIAVKGNNEPRIIAINSPSPATGTGAKL